MRSVRAPLRSQRIFVQISIKKNEESAGTNPNVLSKRYCMLITLIQALRTRVMPSAVARRDLVALTSWRDPKTLLQQRQASTTQDSLRSSDDPRTAAILHGHKKMASERQRPSNHERSEHRPPLLHSPSSEHHHTQQVQSRSNKTNSYKNDVRKQGFHVVPNVEGKLRSPKTLGLPNVVAQSPRPLHL